MSRTPCLSPSSCLAQRGPPLPWRLTWEPRRQAEPNQALVIPASCRAGTDPLESRLAGALLLTSGTDVVPRLGLGCGRLLVPSDEENGRVRRAIWQGWRVVWVSPPTLSVGDRSLLSQTFR